MGLQVRGYPTIKFFPAGAKDFNSAEDYDGGRTSESIVSWAEEKLSDMAEPPEVLQVRSHRNIRKNSPICFSFPLAN